MVEPNEYDLVIIGGGPGGLTAGIYAARAGLKVVLLEGQVCGGQLAMAPEVDNFPGVPKIMGMDLMDKIKAHAQEILEIKELEDVSEVVKSGEQFIVKASSGDLKTRAILLATGATHKTLGLASEYQLLGKGISYCATCDGNFFKGKDVVVIGGGNSALMDALYLKNIGCKVSIIHRRDAFRADAVNVDNARCAGIEFIFDSVVEDFIGTDSLNTVRVKNVKTGKVTKKSVAGAFVMIGIDPNNKMALGMGVTLDRDGYVISDKAQRTNVPFVYAAGDITGGIRQAIVACGEGAVAALSAYEDLSQPRVCKVKK